MNKNLSVVLVVTDGKDTSYNLEHNFINAVKKLTSKKIIFFSCGVGREGNVDHRGLTLLAEYSNGKHIKVYGADGIAYALQLLTSYLIQEALVINQTTNLSYGLSFNKQQLITRNRIYRAAINLVILIDISSSMSEAGGFDNNLNFFNLPDSKLKCTKKAIYNVIDSLNPAYDKVAISSFNECYKSLVKLTSNFSKCKSVLNNLTAFGSTNLYSAINKAVDEFDI